MPRVKGMNFSKDERRRIILQAGLKTFCRIGYDGTNIEDIAEEAKCSHGLIYYYFKDKKEIFDELLVEAKQRADNFSAIFSTSEDLSPIEQLRRDTKSLLEIIELDDNMFLYFQFLNTINIMKKDRDEYSKMPQYVSFDILNELFKKGIKLGEFKEGDSIMYANTYLAIIVGLTTRKLALKNDTKIKFTLPSAEFILQLFIK